MVTELKEETKKSLNDIVLDKSTYAYAHNVTGYGVRALVHVYLIGKALKALNEGESTDKFCRENFLRYAQIDDERRKTDTFKSRKQRCIHRFPLFSDTDIYGGTSDGIFVDQQALLTQDKIFIPKHAEKEIQLFDGDYRNVFESTPDKDSRYERASKLTNRHWSPKDLANRELLMQGVSFGKDLWNLCVEHFEKCVELEKPHAQPESVTRLGREVIEYYSSLIDQIAQKYL